MANIIHEVHDDDSVFTFDTVTRKLVNLGSKKKTIPQYSHNSERLTFELPRYIEGHDMSECNVIQIHYNNIEVKTKNESKDVYECTDMAVEDDKVTFSWLISKKATTYEGSLNFIVILKCVADGELNYAYPTEIYDKIRVSKGLDNGEATEEIFSDVLGAWKAQIMADVEGDINAAVNNKVGSHNVSATAHQDIRNLINNMEIGGRNLLKGTSNEWQEAEVSEFVSGGIHTATLEELGLKAGDTVTASCEIGAVGKSLIGIRIDCVFSGESYDRKASTMSVARGNTGKVWVTFEIPENTVSLRFRISNRNATTEKESTFEKYRGWKLERGNKATDWTPAIDDASGFTMELIWENANPNSEQWFSSFNVEKGHDYYDSYYIVSCHKTSDQYSELTGTHYYHHIKPDAKIRTFSHTGDTTFEYAERYLYKGHFSEEDTHYIEYGIIGLKTFNLATGTSSTNTEDEAAKRAIILKVYGIKGA